MLSALVATLLSGCEGEGEDMPANRRWKPWNGIAIDATRIKSHGTSALISELAGNTLANLADSRRWHGSQLLNYANTGIPYYRKREYVRIGESRTILSFNARNLMDGAGRKLRALVRISDSAADSSSRISMVAKQYQLGIAGFSGTPATIFWAVLDLDVDRIHGVDNTEDADSVSIVYKAGVYNHYVSILSIGIWEPEDRESRRYTDLSSSTVGNDDLPVSAFALELLRNNDVAIRNCRTSHVVMSKCFGQTNPGTSGAYGDDYDGFGTRPTLKHGGATALANKIRFKVHGSAGDTGEISLRAYPLWVLDYDGQTANFVTNEWIYGGTSGARAKIIKQIDAGSTGVLFLSHLLGAFVNNDPLTGSRGGYAVASANQRDPVATEYIAAATQAVAYVAGEWEWTNAIALTGDMISAESELDIRVDAKVTVGAPPYPWIEISNLWTLETLAGAAEVAHVMPVLSDTQINDDVLAGSIKNIRTTQTQIWDRHRQVIINDEQHALPEVNSGDAVVLTRGLLAPSHRSRYLIMRATVEKTAREYSAQLAYSGMAGGPFQVGEKVHQQILSGAAWVTVATAIIEADDTTGDILTVSGTNGNFAGNNGVAIGSHRIFGITSSGSATLDADQTSIDPATILTTVKLVLLDDLDAITYTGTFYNAHEVEITQMNSAEGAFDVVLRVRIPQAYWNTYANGGAMPGPLVFALLAQCTVSGVVSNYERVKLLSAVTYEEPQTELID